MGKIPPILVVGNIARGFKFIGPFDDDLKALAYAKKYLKPGTWTISTLYNPKAIEPKQMKELVRV